MSKRHNRKGYSTGIVNQMTKKLDNVASQIQKDLEDGVISYKFDYKGKQVDVSEELASAVTLMESKNVYTLLAQLFNGMTESEALQLSDSEPIGSGRCRIINAISNADKLQYRYIFLNVFRYKHKFAGIAIMNIVLKLGEMLKDNSADLIYGIEKSTLVSIAYWAKQNGIIDKVLEILPINKDLISSDTDYLEMLHKYNPKFADVYYRYKTGNILGKEFSKELSTECGELPVVRYCSHITSPEYSWRVVEDIVGRKRLADMDYDDKTKEAISHIFQCFYTMIISTVANNFKYTLIGAFAEDGLVKSKNLENEVQRLKDRVNKEEERVVKAKTTIKELKSEIKEYKSSEDKLKQEIKELKDEIAKLKGTGVVDVEPYKNEIEKLNNNIDSLNEQLDSSKRSHIKKETLISKLTDSNKLMSEQLEEKDTIVQELRNKLSSAVNSAGDIPTSALVNYINKHRIIIHGGDTVHTQIKELGLEPVRILKANDSLVDSATVKNCDALVVMTKQLSHGMLESTHGVAEKNNIKTLYFNNMNCRKLCVELFTLLSE